MVVIRILAVVKVLRLLSLPLKYILAEQEDIAQDDSIVHRSR